ncbi:putrescine hydroxycinnamoyltransferase 1 [Brachypodium distachyon]|uniref:Anthranilate N-benzoyltransferase protein 1 n=1 Tax=Brachypodium distachyon TaxID=15368 RepID=I1HV88_BRADI|nr:putrescine hydroxycinnamoyltransferase 1 [Brachypodium distachyon]KQK11564.1 hypothetical protein BRADI_2g60886v3 [Brachypodium distachyon]|eukprot:XP_024316071.1 putrescine hydroxycinnamoyltransferase 1 [Brachypodium distachyon]
MGAKEVKVVESCFLTPGDETPTHGLWLSPLDLEQVGGGHTPTVYFYRSEPGSAGDFFDVARLKAAMAKALVAFYPLAGRLGVDRNGRTEIDCAGQGVLFVVAHSDFTIDDFSDCQPSPELRKLFVPHIDDSSGVVSGIQVTFLKCGGVALGTALHHVAVDGISAFHFFQTWSAFSRSNGDNGTVSLELPCHDRTLLRGRCPPIVHLDALKVFYPFKLNPCEPLGAISNTIFVFSNNQVDTLKRACGGVSTFCAVTAHVWRCMCAARQLPPDTMTRLTLMANVRGRIKPPLPACYFGNAIIWLTSTCKVNDVVSPSEETMVSVANQIKGTIRQMDDEVVHSAIDYLELHEMGSRPAPPIGNSLPKTELRVVSWLGMPVYDADFGWGKPLMMLRAVVLRAGVVYLMDGRQGDGSVQIVVCMETAILNEFERLLYASF